MNLANPTPPPATYPAPRHETDVITFEKAVNITFSALQAALAAAGVASIWRCEHEDWLELSDDQHITVSHSRNHTHPNSKAGGVHLHISQVDTGQIGPKKVIWVRAKWGWDGPRIVGIVADSEFAENLARVATHIVATVLQHVKHSAPHSAALARAEELCRLARS